jgi:Asp-tRNA(Asn)/Glu-tRNA(Gln) amidotransferase A subunit family amidase
MDPFRSLLETAAMLRSGCVSAREVTTAVWARIERLDPTLRSYITVAADRALGSIPTQKTVRAVCERALGNKLRAFLVLHTHHRHVAEHRDRLSERIVWGLPALSIPCGKTDAGMPVHLQIIGPPRGERKVLAAAHALEAELALDLRPPPPYGLQR